MADRRTQAAERPFRVYVDTSVFGGVHDDQFREASQRFFRAVRDGAFTILTSEPLTLEIARAPECVQDTFVEYLDFAETLTTTDEAEDLAEAYMLAKVVPAASRVDALHVALASVAYADIVVSWNFKHLVQLRRIRAFHAVNVLRGYPLIEIRSPLEVIDDQD
jgi:predicted nucleic acid-binding protein